MLAVAFSSIPLVTRAAPADLGEIGKHEAIAIQNSHFSRLPYGAGTSQRMLAQYLDQLDPTHFYFLQSDVEGFRAGCGNDLLSLLITCKGPKTALAIHRIYQQRVAASGERAKQLLAENRFDFTTAESIQTDRRTAPWPRDAREADELLRLKLKDALLDEMLRAERKAKAAPAVPSADRATPVEIVALRYRRLVEKVAKTDDTEAAYAFFNAMARAQDPHSDYMSASKADGFGNTLRNEMVGIGVTLESVDDGSTRVAGILIGGPADQSGVLQPGDRIVGLEDGDNGMTDVLHMTSSEVASLLAGGEGTRVRLRVYPAGTSDLRDMVIARGRVKLKSEEASAGVVGISLPNQPGHRLGWIELPGFYVDIPSGRTACANDVQRLLQRLVASKIDGLVLDLRGNGGGSVDEARRIAGFFTGTGPVLQEKDTYGKVSTLSSGQKAIYPGPLVVLVDRQSASAAEILAGALQDYRRAVVVGDRGTYGKGTVQETIELAPLMPFFVKRDQVGVMKLTTKRFYLPSGASSQLDGIASDIALPGRFDAAEVGERFLPHAFQRDRVRPAPGFTPLSADGLFLPRLRELSKQRTDPSKDFAELREDIALAAARRGQPTRSLQIDSRRQELAEAALRKEERDAARALRFKAQQEVDARTLTFQRLTLDDLARGTGLRSYDPAKASEEFVRVAAPSSTPTWPGALEPAKREALLVLNDLVTCSEGSDLAENRKTPVEIH
ncbi:tail-specific protease [Luteolibacter sp. LG18]|nr:tail-specific protease [Luteolibacter sp. LG18]